MKAQVITEFGNASVFKLTTLPIPALKPGYVLIKVCATSVNPIDFKIRSGAVPAIAPDFPAVLHGDVAGVIEAVAPDVKNFKVGDEVYGCAGGVKGSGGALAEFMAADARLLAKKPRFLTMQETAALPLAVITAWEALFTKAKLSKGEKILIHGGVGGVGHLAVQLAKWCGAYIVTTVRKQEAFPLAQSFGADEIINATEETPEQYVARLTHGQGFNIIFDTVGGKNLDFSLQSAATLGTVVTTQARSTHDLTPLHNKGLSLHAISMLQPLLRNEGREAHGKILSQVAEIADQKQLKPLIDPHSFTLETVKDAHLLLESGKAKGKIVIAIR